MDAMGTFRGRGTVNHDIRINGRQIFVVPALKHESEKLDSGFPKRSCGTKDLKRFGASTWPARLDAGAAFLPACERPE
jgi:hypothetical protein